MQTSKNNTGPLPSQGADFLSVNTDRHEDVVPEVSGGIRPTQQGTPSSRDASHCRESIHRSVWSLSPPLCSLPSPSSRFVAEIPDKPNCTLLAVKLTTLRRSGSVGTTAHFAPCEKNEGFRRFCYFFCFVFVLSQYADQSAERK